jgi:hypothetical protein
LVNSVIRASSRAAKTVIQPYRSNPRNTVASPNPEASIERFIVDPGPLAIWSRSYFKELAQRIQLV